MPKIEQKRIALGETADYYYVGFQPPLTDEEYEQLPMPGTGVPYRGASLPNSNEHFTNPDSQDIGFDKDRFLKTREGGFDDPYPLETFSCYATRIAQYLGDRALDTTIYSVGPGAVTSQADGAPAEW